MDQPIRGAQTGTFVLAAGETKTIASAGEFIRCLAATADFKIAIQGASPMYFASGLQWRAEALTQYDQIDIINDTGVFLTVTMAWGFGELTDSRLNFVGGILQTKLDSTGNTVKIDQVTSGANNVFNITPGGNLSQAAVSVGTSATIIVTSNGNTMAHRIYNNDTETVYLGGSSVTVANGYPLKPGDDYISDGTNSVYGVAVNAGRDVRYIRHTK